jgi:hypothetical protein
VWCEEQFDYTFAGIGSQKVEHEKAAERHKSINLWAKAMGMR